jgi:putative transport protein
MPMETAVGLYAGATTNTPALGPRSLAQRQTNPAAQPRASDYAVAYPFGIMGILLSMLLLPGYFISIPWPKPRR